MVFEAFSSGKTLRFESTHIENEGRHQIIDRWVDVETGEVREEMPHELRELFSPQEDVDERLICQEASAIFLRDGKTPTKMMLGKDEFEKMCGDLYPSQYVPIPDYRQEVQPNQVEAIATTVGVIKLIPDKEKSGYRRYILEDGTVLQEVIAE